MGITNFDSVQPAFETATAVGSAVTINSQTGVIITDNLIGAAASSYALVMTNNRVKAGATGSTYALITLSNLSATVGTATVQKVVPSNGSMTITISNAPNGTVLLTYWLVNPANA